MLVRQLVGSRAGEVLDMPYAVAMRCLAAGTALDPKVQPKPKRRYGRPAGSKNKPKAK